MTQLAAMMKFSLPKFSSKPHLRIKYLLLKLLLINLRDSLCLKL